MTELDADAGSHTSNRHPIPRSTTGMRNTVIPYGLALLTVTLVYWTIDIISPALPTIREDLGLTAAGAGLIFSLMFLGRLAGNVPATWMLERLGAPQTALLGSIGLAAGSLLVAISPSIGVLYAGRIVQGIGISLVVNAALRSIMRSRPAEGAAMTWFGLASTFGGVLGLVTSGVLTETLGWRSVFAWSAALALIAGGLALLSSLKASALVSLNEPQTSASTETSREPRTAFRDLALPLILNGLVFANYSVWVILPLYAQRKFDASPETTASLLMTITVVHLVAALPVGRMIRRRGSVAVFVAGMCISVVGTILVPFAPDLIWLAIPLVLYGVGQIAAVNSGGDIVLRRGHGTSHAVGLLRLSSDLGLVVGPVVAGAVADWQGYGAPFVLLPAIMTLATVAGIVRLKKGPESSAV